MPDWPLEYKEKLILGDSSSNIGIATLWTTREFVSEQLDPNSYAIIGNFYDVFNGIEPFLRNCLANPKLRYFIICGSDRSGSKKTLINFFEKGVENSKIKDTEVPWPIDIPVEDADHFRASSQIFDLTKVITDTNDASQYKKAIEDVIKTLKPLPPYSTPKTYPKTELTPEVFPSTRVAFKVEDKTISQAWLKILKNVQSYGVETQTNLDDGSKVRECINLISVIYEEDPDNPKLPEYMRFSKNDLIEYYKTFCGGEKPADAAYTYGSRFNSKAVSQFSKMAELLKKNKFSKRAYATTWRLDDIFSATPPCVISAQTNFQDDKLFLTVYIRSNDMFRAWPLNAFGLRKIQKNFCEELEFEMGPLTIISQSAHIYKENLKEMELILEKNFEIENDFSDPKGYYTIKTSCNEIEMTHFTTCGTKLRVIKGETARGIMDKLNGGVHPDCPYHIGYLACELSKAEFAIKYGFSYTQDEELVKK